MALGWLKTFTAKTFTAKTCLRAFLGAFGITLGILGPLSIAGAADFYEPPPPPYQGPPPGYYPPQPPAVVVPYGPPVVQRPIEGCRVILRPGVDPYGREVVRRVRICEEEEVAVAPAYPAPPPPRYGYGPRYYEPRPYGWR
jgi:hypothetical protein